MKKAILIIISFFIAVSCSKESFECNDICENIVTIKLSNNFEHYEEPLTGFTRSENDDLWGFQVYRNENGYEASKTTPIESINKQTGESILATHVCYGVFDNLDDMQISLSNKYTYNISLVYIPNGKKLVYMHLNGCYEQPFNSFVWQPNVLNEVCYSEYDYLYSINHITVPSENERLTGLCRTGVDFYYGYVANIRPKENEVISINLKNMIWGLKLKGVKIEGKNYKRLLVRINAKDRSAKDFYMNIDSSKDTTEFIIPKILLPSMADAFYNDPEHTEKVDFSVGTDEFPSDIISGNISVKRNRMEVIVFDITNEKEYDTINPILEDEQMSENIVEF